MKSDKKNTREGPVCLGSVRLDGFYNIPIESYRVLWDKLKEVTIERDSLLRDKTRLESELHYLRIDHKEISHDYIALSSDKRWLEKEWKKYQILIQKHEDYEKEIKRLESSLCLSEKILTDFVGDKKTRDKLIDKYRESIREWDTIFTDKERLESKVTKLKESKEERDKMKEGLRTQKRTITKESLEDIIKQYYNFKTVRIGKILVGTQTPTLYPGSSKLELDIQYIKEDKE